MQKIIPHLWYDREAKPAAEFYTEAFGHGSRVTSVSEIHDTPSGSVDIVNFELAGSAFMAISAGPLFKFNPSISLQVTCATPHAVDALWEKLSVGSAVLMPLGQYPWSDRFGWLQDRYGLSWQLVSVGNGDTEPHVTPVLMFVGPLCGRAEEAIGFYTSVFRDSRIGNLRRFGPDEAPDQQGTLKRGTFTIEGQEFVAADSSHEHNFSFNEAVSLLVSCHDQREIDYYWQKLSAVPSAEQCGWLKDKFGVSWQVVPAAMNEMLATGTKEQVARVTQAFLPMKKFDLAALERAFQG